MIVSSLRAVISVIFSFPIGRRASVGRRFAESDHYTYLIYYGGHVSWAILLITPLNDIVFVRYIYIVIIIIRIITTR